MDISYTTMPVFGTLRRLYRENRLVYMISNRENPENHPICSVDTDMGSSMLFNEVIPQKDEPEPGDSGSSESDYQSARTHSDSGPNDAPSTKKPSNGWWRMSFDGVVSKEGAGAGILIKPLIGEPKLFSYKLHFKCTNNMAEYEALVLGLKVLKDLQVQKINIQGDSGLIIKKVQGKYQTKNPRLRSYRNLVLYLIQGVKECKFTVIPRKKNVEANSLAVSASLFQIPENPKEKYQIEVRNIPSIPDNVDH